MKVDISSKLNKLRARVPDIVFLYCFPVLSFAALVAAIYVARYFLGARNPVIYFLGILYVVLLLGLAWLGYGTGLLICFLSLASRRIVGTTTRTLSADAISFLVMGIISVLISRLGQTSLS